LSIMPLVEGFCEESGSFEPVRELFTQGFKDGFEDNNAQLCVYINGKLIIDLFGCQNQENPDKYGHDSLQMVFSSGKSAESLVVGMMNDRGLLEYDEKVTKYWPEFGKHGKEELTVADIMRHEGGLDYLEHVFTDEDCHRANIKTNSIGKWLEEEKPHWNMDKVKNPKQSKRAYHALTRGWIVGEIVRRVDPNGRTMGEILYEDVTSKGIFLGLPEDQEHLIAEQQSKTIGWFMGQLLTPSFMNSKVETTVMDMLKSLKEDKEAMFRPMACLKDTSKDMHTAAKRYGEMSARKGEMSSCNVNASARGLAWAACIMANKGVDPDGKRIMSEESWKKMHLNPNVAPDVFGGFRTAFTQGGFCHFRSYENPSSFESGMDDRNGWYGWFGFGGSVMQWHPTLNIAFGYVPSSHRWYEPSPKVPAKMQKCIIDCLVQKPL